VAWVGFAIWSNPFFGEGGHFFFMGKLYIRWMKYEERASAHRPTALVVGHEGERVQSAWLLSGVSKI